jgi:hypothetical protein
MTAEAAHPQTFNSLLAQLKEVGFKLIQEKSYRDARAAFKKIIELDK